MLYSTKRGDTHYSGFILAGYNEERQGPINTKALANGSERFFQWGVLRPGWLTLVRLGQMALRTCCRGHFHSTLRRKSSCAVL